MNWKHSWIISLTRTASLEYLVSLRMLAQASRSALILNSCTCFFSNVAFQIFSKKCLMNQMKENSSEGSRSKFRWRIWFVEIWGMSGMEEDTKLWRCTPAALLKLHQKKACWRSSTTDSSHSLQRGDGDLSLRILWTLSCLASRPFSSLHKKENISDPKPFNLAILQELLQSLPG